MLNKEICIRCIKKYVINKTGWNWLYYFEKNWKDGDVACPALFASNKYGKTLENPPDWCPYILEHLMKDEINVE